MCRLLFVQSKNEFEITEHLDQLSRISKNSKEYQGHGWGCSYLEKNNWKHYKNIKPIWEDNLKQFGKTKRLIAHVRSAFEDKEIKVENNMPFYDHKYLFVFNGELRGVKIKSEGRIGAEKIFNFIKKFENIGINSALKKATTILKKRTTYIRAMNIIIADKKKVLVSSLFNEDQDYFQMSVKRTKDFLIVSSEAYSNEEGWKIIPNNSHEVFYDNN